MRRLAAVIACALIGAMCVPASAQDSKWNHNGVYAGIAAGYSTAVLTTPGTDFAAVGAQGGVFGGWGFVGANGLYMGFEMDAILRDIKWSASDGSSTVTASNLWTTTARARIGQALGPMLLYVTGGAALTEQKVTVTGVASATELRWGWVGGAGIEANVTKVMALRVEGLHYQFPDKDFWLAGAREKIGTGETVGRVGLVIRLQ